MIYNIVKLSILVCLSISTLFGVLRPSSSASMKMYKAPCISPPSGPSLGTF